jgi:hypothetical protein
MYDVAAVARPQLELSSWRMVAAKPGRGHLPEQLRQRWHFHAIARRDVSADCRLTAGGRRAEFPWPSGCFLYRQ